MAIRKQNRTLFLIIIAIVVILAFVLRREKKVQEFFEEPVQEQAEQGDLLSPAPVLPDSTVSTSPAPASVNAVSTSTDQQKAFVEVFEDMTECLDIKSASYSEKDPVEIDMVLSQLQTDLGSPRFNSDLWMNWHMRTREGKEKRVRLEIISGNDQPQMRELRYFIVDRDGNPQPVDLEDSKAINPSDETLNQMLREGEVFYKERAGFYAFANGERLEFLEKNGELSEIEMVRGESIFKCSDVRARENCRCLK